MPSARVKSSRSNDTDPRYNRLGSDGKLQQTAKVFRIQMNVSTNLTFKQQRFIEEYQVDSNGSQAVLRAGYNAKYPAEMAYGLLINTKVK